MLAGSLLVVACARQDADGSGPLDRGQCDALIECAASLAPDLREAYEQSYGPAAPCWTNGPEVWAACRDACAENLDALNAMSDENCSLLGGDTSTDGGGSDGGSGGWDNEPCDGVGFYENCSFDSNCCGYATEAERVCRNWPLTNGACTVACSDDSDCPPDPLWVAATFECSQGGCLLSCTEDTDCPEANTCWLDHCYPASDP